MIEPMNRFSFIVACYNSGKYLSECLNSLVNQDYPTDRYEIICIDDGSTDDSPAIMKAYRDSHSTLKVIRTENSGLESSCNRGISMARHPWIVRVDADDVMELNFLKLMNIAIEAEPNFEFYYCKQFVEFYSTEHKKSKEMPEFDPEEIFCRGDFFATGTVYKKSCLQDAGFFPEAIKNCGLENYTVVLRMISMGMRGRAVKDASFYYRRHEENMSKVKLKAIIEYGKQLLAGYDRSFRTNEFHPYGLKINTAKT